MAAIARAVEIKRFEISEKSAKKIIFDELRRDFADWLTAKEDLVWRPPVELTQNNDEFVVKALIAGVDPKDMEVLVAPDIMLIKTETPRGEIARGKLFRPVKFPRAIDPDKVRVEVNDGVLSIKAGIAKAARVTPPMLLAA